MTTLTDPAEMSAQDYISDIIVRSDELSGKIATILTWESIDDITEEQLKRAEFIATIHKAIDSLEDKINEIDSMKRKLRQEIRKQRIDNDKLDREKWIHVNDRKLHRV